MKLAIIGTGIAGLTLAHRLHHLHEITLFEANDHPGGHTHTVDVEVGDERHSIDTGFIVYNDRTYPNFLKLLAELEVAWQPTQMGFSVSDERTGLEYNGGTLNGLFAQRLNLFRPSFYRLLSDIARFNRLAKALPDNTGEEVTIGEFLKDHRFSTQFSEQYLLPMGAAIWSCPLGTFSQFPLKFVVDFYRNHGLLELWNRPVWRVIKGGSRKYVDRILARFSGNLRLRTPIERVRRHADRVELVPVGLAPEQFDHVVFACHSDQALRILGEEATPLEREVLSEIPYGRNVAILHTDSSVLPVRKRAWASWNYRIRKGDGFDSPADVTYNMNILQGLRSEHTFCVTLNPRTPIAPDKVLGEFIYHHPIFSVSRIRAQQRHPELCGPNRTSYCGAYWRNGFHEDGVVSALTVVEALQRLDEGSQHNRNPNPTFEGGRLP